jgi:hypothetical protein
MMLNKALNPTAAFPVAILLYALCFLSMLMGIHHIQLDHDNVLSKGLNVARHWERKTTTASFLRNRTHSSSKFVHERSAADLPPVYMAIPTVPRARNKDYLLKVLQSLENAHFPLAHTYVFNNGNPETHSHLRWQQSETLFSSRGVHFLWNDAPVPEPHPAAYDRGYPLPPEVNGTDRMIGIAFEDETTRKDWRRKECNDFRVIMSHMLDVVYEGVNLDDPVDVAKRNHSWVIFNQDDAQWNVEFFFVYGKLDAAPENVTRWDISGKGLVSIALRADFLFVILEKSKLWCDFIPVDWMVWSCEDKDHGTMRPPVVDNWIKHIGKVSSREGTVAEHHTNNIAKATSEEEMESSEDAAAANKRGKTQPKAPIKLVQAVDQKIVVNKTAIDETKFNKPLDNSVVYVSQQRNNAVIV